MIDRYDRMKESDHKIQVGSNFESFPASCTLDLEEYEKIPLVLKARLTDELINRMDKYAYLNHKTTAGVDILRSITFLWDKLDDVDKKQKEIMLPSPKAFTKIK